MIRKHKVKWKGDLVCLIWRGCYLLFIEKVDAPEFKSVSVKHPDTGNHTDVHLNDFICINVVQG